MKWLLSSNNLEGKRPCWISATEIKLAKAAMSIVASLFYQGIALKKGNLELERVSGPVEALSTSFLPSFWLPNRMRAFYGLPSAGFLQVLGKKTGVKSFRKWTINFFIIVMHHLLMGIHSEKCVIRWFHHSANIIEFIYTSLVGIAYYSPRLHGSLIAPRLQMCTTCYCTENCKQL